MDYIRKLCLGTAQFGMNYGISNVQGRPEQEVALRILKDAYQTGICCIDTAYAYGDAQKIIFAAEHSVLQKNIRVITKISSDDIDKLDESQTYYGVLLHRPDEMNNADVIKKLMHMKVSGRSDKIGISVYTPAEAVAAMRLNIFDIIQMPYNLIDKRFETAGVIDDIKSAGIELYCRSAFLQGLLLMDISSKTAQISGADNVLRELAVFSSETGYSTKRILMEYVLNDTRMDYVVFGVNSQIEYEEIIAIARQPQMDPETLRYLSQRIGTTDENLLNPTCWKLGR